MSTPQVTQVTGCCESTVARIRSLPVSVSSIGIAGLEYRGISSTDGIVLSLFNMFCIKLLELLDLGFCSFYF